MSYLSDEQIAQLLRPINPGRVKKDRDGMSHLEGYDVRAHLTRIFGFGRWSCDLLESVMLYEDLAEVEKNGTKKNVVSVGYRARVQLKVHAPDGTLLATYTEEACGAATNFPAAKRADAHDFATKTAQTQAMKRCAVNLGDNFGASLYRSGYLGAIVLRTLVGQPEADTDEAVDQDAPPVAEMGEVA